VRRVLAAAVTTAAISTASWGPLPAVGATSAGRTDVPGLEPQLALSVQQATGQQTGSQPTGTDRTSSPSLVPVEVFVTDPAAARASIVSRGGVITGEVPGAVLQARVPAPRVAELTTAAGVHSIRAPRRQQHPQSAASFGPTTGQSPQLSGADAWHTAGIIGTGASVGIIDFFDLRLWNVAEHGPTPSAANGRMFCKDSSGLAPNFCIGPDIDPAQGDGHGVAVAEIVKDMAPGAELYIAQVATLADYRDAIDFFDLKGVNIVTRSLVSPYDGPGDGTGPYGAIVDYAASKGITWFNSAGNEGLDQYMRFAVQDTDGDRLMEFAAGDELLRIDGVPAGGGLFCYTSFGVRWSNDWYNANGTLTDYRVEVYEAANPLAIGTPHTNPTSLAPIDLYPSIPGVQSFVDFNQRSVPSGAKVGVDEDPLEMDGEFWCNTSGVSYLQLRRDANTPVGNPGDVVEVMFYNGLIEADYGTASGAASGPVVDSRNPALVAVGAIDPPASGTIARYSSQGPTIDGRLKPEVAGHACVTSTIFSPCLRSPAHRSRRWFATTRSTAARSAPTTCTASVSSACRHLPHRSPRGRRARTGRSPRRAFSTPVLRRSSARRR
jgi:hypothetical protein